MSVPQPEMQRLYTPQEVSQLFKVDPKTVSRWAIAGKIPPSAVVRTLGRHRRFYADQIDALLKGDQS